MMILFVDWCSIARLIRGGSMSLRFVGVVSLLSLFATIPSTAMADDPPVEVEPYGFARLDAVYLTHRMNHPQYSMWVRPEDVSSGGTPNLTIYGRLTRVGVDFDVSGVENVDITGKVEADFQNGGSESRPAPRLRHGYGRVASDLWFVLAGQTWDLVSPLYPSAHADALMWNAGNLGDRRPQLRLGVTPGDEEFGLRVAAAAGATGAIDGQDLDDNGRLDGFESGVPMMQGLVELRWTNWTDAPATVGVSGSWAMERLSEDLVASPERPGYGGETVFLSRSINAHLALPLVSWWALRGEAFYGSNLSDVRGGIGQSMNRFTGEELRAVGGWAESLFTPIDVYSLSVGVAIDDVLDEDLPPREAANRRTQNRAAYAVHKFRPWDPVQIGLEYWYWQTEYTAAPTGTAHRVNLHTSVFF